MKKAIYILLPLLVISLTSCDKFEDGGSRKKAEANLTNVWIIDGYFMNDEEKTDELIITSFEETFADNGTYTRIYRDGNANEVSQLGSWTLDADNDLVSFTGGGSMDLTASITGVATSSYTINRLTKNKFWYQFESGGNTHEFWMVSKD